MGFFGGLPESTDGPLQRVQNNNARLITNNNKMDPFSSHALASVTLSTILTDLRAEPFAVKAVAVHL